MSQDITSSAPVSPSSNIGQKLTKLVVFLLKSFLIAAIIVGVGAYLLCCPRFAVPNYLGDIVLFPIPPGQEYAFISKIGPSKEVTFTNSNGDKLHGVYYTNPKSTKVVLFCHGNAGNIGHRLLHAKAILEAGASVFLYDYRSFGKSTGKKKFTGLMDDANSAYKYVVDDLQIKPENVILYGESIGGGVASTLLKEHPNSGGLILDSAFTSLLGIGKRKISVLNIYPDFLGPDPSMSCMEVISKPHPPLLILHGQVDGAIPYSEAEANYAAAVEPKKLVGLPHSGHNNKTDDAELYLSSLKEYFAALK